MWSFLSVRSVGLPLPAGAADNTELVETCHLLRTDMMEGIEGWDKGTLGACYIACQPMGGWSAVYEVLRIHRGNWQKAVHLIIDPHANPQGLSAENVTCLLSFRLAWWYWCCLCCSRGFCQFSAVLGDESCIVEKIYLMATPCLGDSRCVGRMQCCMLQWLKQVGKWRVLSWATQNAGEGQGAKRHSLAHAQLHWCWCPQLGGTQGHILQAVVMDLQSPTCRLWLA